MDDLMNEECLLFSKLRECDVDDALRIETESFAKPWPRHAFEEAVDKRIWIFLRYLMKMIKLSRRRRSIISPAKRATS